MNDIRQVTKIGASNRSVPILIAMMGFGVVFYALTFGGRASFFESQIVTVSGILMLGAGTTAALFGYLQDFRRSEPRASLNPDSKVLQAAIRRELKSYNVEMSVLTTSEKSEILAQAKDALSQETVQQLAEVWRKEFRVKDVEERDFEDMKDAAGEIVARLQGEVSALGRRANTNLAIGAVISAIGLAVLTWFVWTATNELTASAPASDVGIRFFIRLTLAIFIQLFAYFFLRLYRYSLFEIKYFQNEITGAQFRILALFSAFRKGEGRAIDKLALELIKTERNFILKKGETTVAIQREAIEKDYDAQIVKAVETAISKKESAK